jgi:hypothetical protein
MRPIDEDPEQAVMQSNRQDNSIAWTYENLPWIR